MAITTLQVITDALREINVIPEVGSASAEQGSYCLRKLNQLMESLREQEIDVGYFSNTTTTDNCPIPDWCEAGVTAALALMVAPRYGASVSPEHMAVLDNTISMMYRKGINEKLTNTDMSHLPLGQGHLGQGYYDIDIDFI